MAGLGLTGGPRQGGGALGGWVGLCVTSEPQPPLGALLEEGWWYMIEAELSFLGLVLSRSHQVCYSHLHQEKSAMLKRISWQWLNLLFLQNIRS